MDFYAETDYRQAIRTRLKERNLSRTPLTLKKIAAKIPVQYTYLSKALNDDKTHLNEDHLHSLCRILEFYPEEMDYLFLLRAHATSQDSGRKHYLQSRLDRFRKARKLNASIQDYDRLQLTREGGYLFDPLCTVIHVALHIDEMAQNPRRLCAPLGISVDKLQECLRKLAQLDFLEVDSDGWTILKLNKGHIHYSTDHPLMRVHQNLLRSLGASQLVKLPEGKKHNFMVTFSAEPETLQMIQEAFQEFLEKIEKWVVSSRSRHAYQLCFDLFEWV
jgi:hypothetical protein